MLQVYTPDYLGELDTLVARAMQKNFYVRYVCHIGKNTDIIIGSTLADAIIGDIPLVRKNNRVFVLPKYVKLMNQTVTG